MFMSYSMNSKWLTYVYVSELLYELVKARNNFFFVLSHVHGRAMFISKSCMHNFNATRKHVVVTILSRLDFPTNYLILIGAWITNFPRKKWNLNLDEKIQSIIIWY